MVFPGVVNGFIGVHTSTDLYGFDANFRKNLICSCDYRVDGLVGYRYLNLQDDVTINENLTVLSADNPAIPQGTTFALQDRFKTINDFNGGQIGLAGETWSGRWYLSGRNLIALGNTHTETTISGVTVATTPGGTPIVNAGGLLTQPTNIGTYNNDKFSVVYEAQTSLGYQVTDGIRAFVSYSFLYWTDVARAGDQIDFVVNSSQIPPGALRRRRPPGVRPQRHQLLGPGHQLWSGDAVLTEKRYKTTEARWPRERRGSNLSIPWAVCARFRVPSSCRQILDSSRDAPQILIIPDKSPTRGGSYPLVRLLLEQN